MVTQSERIKVAICIPSGDDVKMDFALSLALLVGHSVASGIALTVENRRFSNIAQGRETIASRVLNDTDCSHFLWIDSDMMFPQWALTHLLERNVDIVGANASMRQARNGAACTRIQDDGTVYRDSHTRGNDLREADALGFGFMLMKRHVLESVEAPRFPINFNPRTSTHEGEDIGFCKKVRAKGYKVFVDPILTRSMGHVGNMVHTLRKASPHYYSDAVDFCWGPALINRDGTN